MSNSIDYLEWAKEYEAQARKFRRIISKYEKLLEDAKTSTQRKLLHENIMTYEVMYKEHKQIVKLLKERGKYG